MTGRLDGTDGSAAAPSGRPEVAVVGGGPAGLIAAETLAQAGLKVTVFDRMPSPARKLLIAGRGGLNLTHGEDLDLFLTRYGTASARLEPIIRAFPPAALRAWCEDLGQETFVGSSGRVFPRAFKASPLLRAWLLRFEALEIRFAPRHRWAGWNASGDLAFEGPAGQGAERPAATILALGGASWPRLGSDGAWAGLLAAAGIAVGPLEPSNMGVQIAWSDRLLQRFEGAPLKRIALAVGADRRRGEAVITRRGLEGGAVYALSPAIRAALAASAPAILTVDLRPDLAVGALASRLGAPRGHQSLSTFLRRHAGLAPAAVALWREATDGIPATPAELAASLKAVRFPAGGVEGLERAISTAGGVRWDELDDRLMLRKRPGVFCAGEMVDWEAPTGGYLLQASFATGRWAARGVIDWLGLEHRVAPAPEETLADGAGAPAGMPIRSSGSA